ncbi:hypothetical protein M8494_02810 [Serratia ureilytica]
MKLDFQQGEDADFIPLSSRLRKRHAPIAYQMASSTLFAVHLFPYGVWDDIGHATGFCPAADENLIFR